jgi:hypothetical protein
LAALVRPPRANLTRFHGVFAPNSRYRARVVPGRKKPLGGKERSDEEATLFERRASMTWAQRLKRVFGIDIETCPACRGAVGIVAVSVHSTTYLTYFTSWRGLNNSGEM